MKINKTPRIEVNAETGLFYKELAVQINGISEGRIAQHYAARSAAPTAETWQQGDFIRNSTPTELGAAASKYVIKGWICTVAGTPGTWLQQRTLTGN